MLVSTPEWPHLAPDNGIEPLHVGESWSLLKRRVPTPGKNPIVPSGKLSYRVKDLSVLLLALSEALPVACAATSLVRGSLYDACKVSLVVATKMNLRVSTPIVKTLSETKNTRGRDRVPNELALPEI